MLNKWDVVEKAAVAEITIPAKMVRNIFMIISVYIHNMGDVKSLNKIQNPNIEIRNPKRSDRNNNYLNSKRFEFFYLVIKICFEIRNSCFGFLSIDIKFY